MSRPSPPPTGERREQLLDVTKAIVAAHGFHAVSIEARRARGRDHAADRLRALRRPARRCWRRWSSARARGRWSSSRACSRPTSRRASRARSCSPALRAYLEAVRADPDTWRLVLMPPEGAPDAAARPLARGRAAVVAPARRGGRARASGPGGPSPDPELTARTLSAIADESRAAAADRARALPGRAADRARRAGSWSSSARARRRSPRRGRRRAPRPGWSPRRPG